MDRHFLPLTGSHEGEEMQFVLGVPISLVTDLDLESMWLCILGVSLPAHQVKSRAKRSKILRDPKWLPSHK